MKQSRYNYIYHTPAGSYWMNGITRACLKFSPQLGKKVEEYLADPAIIKSGSPKLYEMLSEGGFIVPREMDEVQVIRDGYRRVTNAKDYFLVIMPTLDCNFKCPYCVQSHIPSQMSPETIQMVKKHLKYMVEVEGISSLMIEWFGGEPFLYFKEVVEPISIYARELCERNGIPFFSAATSNASLIVPKVAEKLSDLKFTRFQITLDGDRALHNTIKFSQHLESAFDTTLENIATIVRLNPMIRISLRINYTEKTLHTDIVKEVCDKIPEDLRKNVTVTLKKVWQDAPDPARFKYYLQLLDNFRREGFNVTWLDVAESFMPCYVNKKYYTCINYHGGLVKCTNSDILYAHHSPGKIQDDGSILWDPGIEEKNMDPAFENDNCIVCRRLPLCMGHCPRNHIEGQEWSCKWSCFDIDLKAAVIARIEDGYAGEMGE